MLFSGRVMVRITCTYSVRIFTTFDCHCHTARRNRSDLIAFFEMVKGYVKWQNSDFFMFDNG